MEMAGRLRTVAPDLEMVGLEIDRIGSSNPVTGAVRARRFRTRRAAVTLVQAFNVLRQYDDGRVEAAWGQMRSALAPGGLIVEGTCDEIGRRCCWVLLDADGPRSLTFSWSPAHTGYPSELAERLPKVLIHHNVPGEPVHELLAAADRCWDMAAGFARSGRRSGGGRRWRCCGSRGSGAGESAADSGQCADGSVGCGQEPPGSPDPS